MSETSKRFVRKQTPPSPSELEAFVGATAFGFWQDLVARIDESYPGTFAPDWSNGGQKHGWGLRFKKSRSLLTLIPESGGVAVMVVFGAAEREKMTGLLDRLDLRFRTAYEEAPTYHDGKWVLYPIQRTGDLDDIMTALTTKRRPKPAP